MIHQLFWDLLNVTFCVQHCPISWAVELDQNEITRYELNHLNKARAFLSYQTHNAIAWEGLDNECMVQSAKLFLFAFSGHLENLTVRAVDVLCRLHGPAPTLIIIVIMVLL